MAFVTPDRRKRTDNRRVDRWIHSGAICGSRSQSSGCDQNDDGQADEKLLRPDAPARSRYPITRLRGSPSRLG